MRPLALALLAVFAAAAAQTDPLRPAVDDKAFAKLRGVTFFYIDVVTSENRPEEVDLRGEIRDGMELELRRANITPKAIEGLGAEAATPLLLKRADGGAWMDRLISAALKDENGDALDGAFNTVRQL